MTRALIYALLICGMMTLGLIAIDMHRHSADPLAPDTREHSNTKTDTKGSDENNPLPETQSRSKPEETRQNGDAKHPITVTAVINGIRNTRGNIIAQLYDNKEAFINNRYEQAVSSIMKPTKGFGGELRFSNLPPNDYAIVLFHDENNNQRFDQTKTFIEGYAYSNNTGKNAPAEFQQAVFDANADTKLILSMIYH